MTVGGNKRDAKQLLPDCKSSFLPKHRTTMTGTNSSTNQRNWRTNSFSMMEASSSCQTQLGGSDFCTRWTGLNLCAERRRITSCILCGVSLRQEIVFGSSTSSLPDDVVPLSGADVWLAGSSPRGHRDHSRLAGSVGRPFSGSYRDGLSPEQFGGTGPSRLIVDTRGLHSGSSPLPVSGPCPCLRASLYAILK